MINQSLDHLKLFLTVCQAPTLKDAAQQLSVSPPAISTALKKFEKSMGVQLFLREHKKVQLTSQGKALMDLLLPHFQMIESNLQDFIHQTQSREPRGRITIGAPVELGSTQLVQSYVSFNKKYDQVKAGLKFATPLQIMEMVAQGRVDFGLMADGPHVKLLPPQLTSRPFFDEEMVLVCSKTFKKEMKFKDTYEELRKLPHLDYTMDGSAVGYWYHFHYKVKAPKLNVVFSGENAISLLEGVKGNLGLAMIPVQRFKSEINQLHVIRPTGRSLLGHILLIQHQNKVPSLAEKLFIKHMLETKNLFE